MVKKYIGKVRSSKFRRKNSNITKKGRKGRKSRKTMKKRIMQIGGVLELSPLTHVKLSVGSANHDPNTNQLIEISKLFNNEKLEDGYIIHNITEMLSKIYHPLFFTREGEGLELKINSGYKPIDSLRIESGDEIFSLKKEQKKEIEILKAWISSDTPEPTAPKFIEPGYLCIDVSGYLYFLGHNEGESYIRHDNPPLTSPKSHKSKSPKSHKSKSPKSHKNHLNHHPNQKNKKNKKNDQ